MVSLVSSVRLCHYVGRREYFSGVQAHLLQNAWYNHELTEKEVYDKCTCLWTCAYKNTCRPTNHERVHAHFHYKPYPTPSNTLLLPRSSSITCQIFTLYIPVSTWILSSLCVIAMY